MRMCLPSASFQPCKRVFLHGGDEEIAVRRKGDADMRAGPFEFGGLAGGGGEMQRRAIVAGDARCACPSARRRGLRRSADARSSSSCRRASAHGRCGRWRRRRRLAGRPPCAETHLRPISASVSARAVGAEGETLPSSPPVIRAVAVQRGRRRQSSPSWAVDVLVAVVEAVDRAVGQREMRNVGQPGDGDAVGGEIERGDCGHGSRSVRVNCGVDAVAPLRPAGKRGADKGLSEASAGLARFEGARQALLVEIAADEDQPRLALLAILPRRAGGRLR